MTKNEILELEVQRNVINHIDIFKSFRFNAGAGAGKTYALIETLKYVTHNKIAATNSPQKVACITYTNVAVNEIKNRLGNSDKVHVSTIHEMLWDIIKKAQPQLLICHKDKINDVLNHYSNELLKSDNSKFYINLDETKRQELYEYAIQTREFFYRSKNLCAKCFREAYVNDTSVDKPVFLHECLKSIKNFKFVVELFYKKQRLKECLEKIENKKLNRVFYDSKVNIDRLHYMKFSHNTLLEYGLKLVETYPTLCRVIIDSYPYFFIDEYQDTHSNVIKFVKILHDYAIQHNKDWMVGYFGDTAQCIYEDGIGRDIAQIHGGLSNIYKIFNRRSHQQIINVANDIRDDEVVQKPIFDERNMGSVILSHYANDNKVEAARNFLSDYKKDLCDTDKFDINDRKIHCLVLTNRLMATFNGFEDVYNVYKNSSIFYDNLNTQVLSQQLEKLHPTVLTIYHFVKLYQDIQQDIVSYYNIFGPLGNDLEFSKASLAISALQNKDIKSYIDWVKLITDCLKNSDINAAMIKLLINRVNYDKNSFTSLDSLEDLLLDSINILMNSDSDDEEVAKEKNNSVLSLPIESLIKWVNFIDGIEVSDINFHTYHGTKGEEYMNVAIILEHSFGKDKCKFKRYFDFLQQNEAERNRLLSDPIYEKEHTNTKNLLYVACSRAIQNLRIMYLDDISEIQNGVESIFGKSTIWSINAY